MNRRLFLRGLVAAPIGAVSALSANARPGWDRSARFFRMPPYQIKEPVSWAEVFKLKELIDESYRPTMQLDEWRGASK